MAIELMRRYETDLSSLLDHAEAQAAHGAAWLRGLREQAIAIHREHGFPTPKNEEWKYTPLRAAASREWRLAEPGPAVFERDLPFVSDGARVVFVNGLFDRNQLSFKPVSGLTIKSLRDAIDAGEVEGSLGEIAKIEEHSLAALNTALFEDGVYIHLAAGTSVSETIEIVHVTSGDGQIITPRVLIIAEQGTKASIVETYVTDGDGTNLVLPVTEVLTASGANIEHVRVQVESDKTYSVALWEIRQEGESEYRSYNIAFGGAIARTDQNLWLGGEYIVTRLDGIVIANGKQLIDNHTRLDHAMPNCNSFEIYKQIVDGEATVVFNGKIFVHQDAQKTDAVQTNQALLLSPKATINSKPQLEIFADDVKCTHGATVGQIEEEQLFYLRTRGLAVGDATAILVFAFAAEVLDLISDEGVRKSLEKRILAKLSS
ncbi:MAG: Fe-S cluster assembly protein SufD [Armatimonadetes bacterium]|nr:Fe-S cluster assembly protein SufD [Armatimonadota bacterium]